jgi:hypothetical protein
MNALNFILCRSTNKLMNRLISIRIGVAKDKDSIRVYLEPKIKEEFKTSCFDRGLNMSDVTAELIEEWIKKNPPLKSHNVSQPQTIAQIVQQHFWTLRQHNVKNIDEIAVGQPPTQADLAQISSILNLAQGELFRLAQREFGELPKPKTK